MAHTAKKLRIVAVGDTHCSKTSAGALEGFFAACAERGDVLVLCGDLTDFGLPEEARILAKELAAAGKVPILAVLGNHDFESGKEDVVRQILTEAGVTVLDGDALEVRGVGFAGIKGFAGGFGRGTLQAWGEKAVKSFVQEAHQETLKLETALARLRTPQRIALLHYSPIQRTVEGEPPEIYAFLGTSRHEEPIERFGVTAVFHGHAHRGRPEGQTRSGIPVYNVAMPLLKRAYPDRPPFRMLEVPLAEVPEAATAH
jgi:Icc-related predicted phosphoesterase